MVSIFATDLTQQSPATGMPSGIVHSCDAIALAVDLAGHFGLSFADVEQRLSAILPNSLVHLRSADGWRLFGQYLAASVPTSAPEYRPVIH